MMSQADDEVASVELHQHENIRLQQENDRLVAILAAARLEPSEVEVLPSSDPTPRTADRLVLLLAESAGLLEEHEALAAERRSFFAETAASDESSTVRSHAETVHSGHTSLGISSGFDPTPRTRDRLAQLMDESNRLLAEREALQVERGELCADAGSARVVGSADLNATQPWPSASNGDDCASQTFLPDFGSEAEYEALGGGNSQTLSGGGDSQTLPGLHPLSMEATDDLVNEMSQLELQLHHLAEETSEENARLMAEIQVMREDNRRLAVYNDMLRCEATEAAVAVTEAAAADSAPAALAPAELVVEGATTEAVTQVTFKFENLDFDKVICDAKLTEMLKNQAAEAIAYSARVPTSCVEVLLSKGSVVVDAKIHGLDPDGAELIKRQLDADGDSLLQNVDTLVSQIPEIADVVVEGKVGLGASGLRTGVTSPVSRPCTREAVELETAASLLVPVTDTNIETGSSLSLDAPLHDMPQAALDPMEVEAALAPLVVEEAPMAMAPLVAAPLPADSFDIEGAGSLRAPSSGSASGVAEMAIVCGPPLALIAILPEQAANELESQAVNHVAHEPAAPLSLRPVELENAAVQTDTEGTENAGVQTAMLVMESEAVQTDMVELEHEAVQTSLPEADHAAVQTVMIEALVSHSVPDADAALALQFAPPHAEPLPVHGIDMQAATQPWDHDEVQRRILELATMLHAERKHCESRVASWQAGVQPQVQHEEDDLNNVGLRQQEATAMLLRNQVTSLSAAAARKEEKRDSLCRKIKSVHVDSNPSQEHQLRGVFHQFLRSGSRPS